MRLGNKCWSGGSGLKCREMEPFCWDNWTLIAELDNILMVFIYFSFQTTVPVRYDRSSWWWTPRPWGEVSTQRSPACTIWKIRRCTRSSSTAGCESSTDFHPASTPRRRSSPFRASTLMWVLQKDQIVTEKLPNLNRKIHEIFRQKTPSFKSNKMNNPPLTWPCLLNQQIKAGREKYGITLDYLLLVFYHFASPVGMPSLEILEGASFFPFRLRKICFTARFSFFANFLLLLDYREIILMRPSSWGIGSDCACLFALGLLKSFLIILMGHSNDLLMKCSASLEA